MVRLKSKSILIVDDEMAIRTYLSRLLKSKGYETFEAPSAPLARRIAVQKQPSLILLDIHLGESFNREKTDGIELCEFLKREEPSTKRIPVIMVTVLGTPEFVKASMAAGASAFVVKPFEPEKLLEKIESLLAAADADEAPPEPPAGEEEWVDEEEAQKRSAPSGPPDSAPVVVKAPEGRRRGRGLASRLDEEGHP